MAASRAQLLGLYRRAVRAIGDAEGAPTKAYLRTQLQTPQSDTDASFLPEDRIAGLREWLTLVESQVAHTKLLDFYGIGQRIPERERVKVNARRVGLEVPAFPDEKPLTAAN